VLVAEDGHDPAALAENPDRFLEKAPPRVQGHAQGVRGVFAHLGDQEYAIDGEVLAAEGQRLADGRGQGEAVFLGQADAQVVVGPLVGVEADELKVRPAARAVQVIAFQEPADDHFRVRVPVEDRDGRGDLFGGLRGRGLRCRCGQYAQGRGQEIATAGAIVHKGSFGQRRQQPDFRNTLSVAGSPGGPRPARRGASQWSRSFPPPM
jgi:hypothetical protein